MLSRIRRAIGGNPRFVQRCPIYRDKRAQTTACRDIHKPGFSETGMNGDEHYLRNCKVETWQEDFGNPRAKPKYLHRVHKRAARKTEPPVMTCRLAAAYSAGTKGRGSGFAARGALRGLR